MEDSKYQGVKELAKQIRTSVRKRSSSDNGIHPTSEPATKIMRCSPLDVSRLKARYIKHLSTDHTDWSLRYVRLALVKGEKVIRADKNLEEITRLTLQGQVDELLLRKEPIADLRDIFHYENKPCPRVILIMGGPGIGKTTLAYELCVRWARDGFLAQDFDAVVLIPLRSVQQRSFEEIIMEYVGEDNYQQLKKSAGSRCLIILEGLDELAANRRQSDVFLVRLIKECTMLEKATILITSRPHACERIDAGRRVEVVGFGKDEIREFAEKSFSKDIQSVEEFLKQLNEYPQLHSLCYVPINLVMIVDIFQCSEKKLPSTLTELYRVFIVMTLKRQVEKENVAKKPAVCSSVAVRAANSVEETLCVMLKGIPKETVGIVLCLSRLAYRGFFDWYCHREGEYSWGKWKEPKIIFTESDLMQCDIEVTSDFDAFGLLKATHTHQLLTHINTYNFNHLSIQEYLCAVYISLQSQQEQLRLLREHFHEYPNIFNFVCGLVGLASSEMFQFIYSKLTSPGHSLSGNPDVITAMRLINESKQSSGPHQSVSPFTLNITGKTLLPYDYLCLSNVLSCYAVSQLKMMGCSIGNKGAELLVKYYPSKNTTSKLLEELDLSANDLTSEGMEHVMKIVRTSSATFRVLDVSSNYIGDEGMAILSEALHHNKSLTTLNVAECGLSVKGVISISKMMVNHSLQHLHMKNNSIYNDGISTIAGALGHGKINSLDVSGCGITLTGAKSLAAALSSNHTITELWLSNNPITVEGALLIVKSAVNNTVCQCVVIDDKYVNDEIMKMMDILWCRSIQHKLLLQKKIRSSTVNRQNNNSRSEELVHTLPIIAGDGPTVNMEMSLMNQGEDDDHSGGQEETRDNRLP